ncbi:YeeE/YedE family protein [Roseateles violae]|uniref:YeeE/YedE family protein n=1 Tax=Roseateles violae TaxID=3058042 RepID=A0ABT8DS45_9BURK|nr:YeeE/YedE family protein [Pelomonas sp. PFR6]MDN3919888.1 YeeE/YedE family protein [Pelomonas sp. PFR6]
MQEIDLAALGHQVLWAAFGLAFVFGAIAQRTHFCTMGAVADIVNMGDWARMRMWVLAIGVAMLGFNAMVGLGWLDAGKSIYAAPRLLWLSNLVGGLMFGFGMVLASGCGSKTLVRIGAGNLKSLVVFVVMGIAAFATLKGITAVLRVATVDAVAVNLGGGQDLPSLLAPGLGLAKQDLALWLGGVLGLALVGWALVRTEGRSADVLLGGIGSGAVITGIWWVSGRLGYVAEDPNTLQEAFVGSTSAARMEGLSFVSPMAYTLDWLMFFSDKSKVLTIAIVATVGVALGSGVYALATRSFRWEAFRGVEDVTNHLLGAVLMGIGGVVALGCTIGQGISGVSTLSIGSFIALAAIIAGAVAALRFQVWRLERSL